MTDNDLKWIVRRWGEASTEDNWRVISHLMHGAWMAVIHHSTDEADVYDTLYYIAQAHRDELFNARFANLTREAA